MLFEHWSYRTYLKSVLLERIRANPSYSLRAFAKHCGFSSSQISEALNGRANFSTTSLRKIAGKLKLNPNETEYLCLIGELEREGKAESRAEIAKRIENVVPKNRALHDLSIDSFVQISEWYHSVILELVYLKGFAFTPANIAKRLGISKIEAEVAVERLERLELISLNGEGNFERTDRNLQIRLPKKNAAMRTFYRQMMEKASTALETQKPGERWSGYETLPFAPEAMPELSQAFEEFFEEVIHISGKYPKKREVYHLLLHFFNTTQSPKRIPNS